ncbi:MAG: FecR domain-containing protein [Chloroflexi bacterium]|nr:FecR domain-containing protein [Chloroflexota bacterium]
MVDILRGATIGIVAILLFALTPATTLSEGAPVTFTEQDCDCSSVGMKLGPVKIENGEAASSLRWRCELVQNGKQNWSESFIYYFSESGPAAENFAYSKTASEQAVQWVVDGLETARLVAVVDQPDSYGSLRYYPAEGVYWGEIAHLRGPSFYATAHLTYSGVDETEAKEVFSAASRRIMLIMDNKMTETARSFPPPEKGAMRMGIVIFHSGTVELQRPPSEAWIQIETGMPLFSGDRIRAMKESRVEIFVDSSRIVGLDSDSMFSLPAVSGSPPMAELSPLNLARGHMWVKMDAPTPRETQVRTSDALVSVKDAELSAFEGINGIEFEVASAGGATFVNVLNGVVWVSDTNKTKTAAVDAGKTIRCESGGVPSDPKPIDFALLNRWWKNFPDQASVEDETGGPTPTATEPASTPSPTAVSTPTPVSPQPESREESDSDGVNVAVIIVPVVVGLALAAIGIFYFMKGRREAAAARAKKSKSARKDRAPTDRPE